MNKTFLLGNNIINDFPQLHAKCYNEQLSYLDNAATTQKPKHVINKITDVYTKYCANIHRSIHYLSEIATQEYEDTRHIVANFINAEDSSEIIFTKGTTEAINLVAFSYGLKYITHKDEIIISEMEHHSNIVPWQILCQQTGAILKIAPIDDNGDIILQKYFNLLNKKTKLVALNHISNTLGTINPIKEMILAAKTMGAKTLIDGAQAPLHINIDVKNLNCDFYTFSSHKMLGPTGVGVLYGNKNLLSIMSPYQSGGNMIEKVELYKSTYVNYPFKFESGTPNIAGVIGFKEAILYLDTIGLNNIINYEQHMLKIATSALKTIKNLTIIGTSKNKISILSFILNNIHPHDISSILDRKGIAIRAGHLCTQPIMKHFNISSVCRISLTFYNTIQEIYNCVNALQQVKEVMCVK